MVEPGLECDVSQALIFFLIIWAVGVLAVYVFYQFLKKIFKSMEEEEE